MDWKSLALAGVAFFLLARRGGSYISERLFIAGRPQVRVLGARPWGLALEIIFPIGNNSGVPIPVGRFDGALMYGSVKVSDVWISQPVTIRGEGTTQLVTQAGINFQSLPGEIGELFRSGRLLSDLRLTGRLFYGNTSIPVDYTVRVL